MGGQPSRAELYNRLDDIIRKELDAHPPHTWSLKFSPGTSHIKIYVGSMMVGVQKGKPCRSQNQDYKAPLAVRSQIRRAYAGVASITGARVAPAVIGDSNERRKARA